MTKIVIRLISIYQATLSRVLEYLFGKGCKFSPTCSQYAKEAINIHGIIKGVNYSFKRTVRCHPFSKTNYYDPVGKE